MPLSTRSSVVANVHEFLSTSGVPFDTKPVSVTISAMSYHPVTLSGKPLENGPLLIKGCHVQAPGGASREFLLPLATVEEEEHQLRRQSLADCEAGRTKFGGLDSRPGKSMKRTSTVAASSSSRRAIPKYLECTVVPEQPLLRIRWSSLTHSAVMLYNGERYDHKCGTMILVMADLFQIYSPTDVGEPLKSAHRLSKVNIR